MARRAVYLYTCDEPGCDIQELGPPVGAVRTKRDSGHWCLKHYPYDTCSHCDHPLRPAGSLKKDWPGTKARGAEGLCSTCYLHLRNYGKLAESARPSRKAA